MWPKEGLCGPQWWPLWHDSRIFWSPLKTTSMLWVRWTPCCEWGGGFSVLLHESVPRISQLTVAVICICIQFWKCFAFCYHGIVSWYLQCSPFFYLLDLINWVLPSDTIWRWLVLYLLASRRSVHKTYFVLRHIIRTNFRQTKRPDGHIVLEKQIVLILTW